jgi:Spy/CpxP family protein refolding chaperone
MARQTAWVLALVITCAPASIAAARAEEQGKPDKATPAQTAAGKEKPTAAAAPTDRERFKWWLYNRAELGISDQQSTDINQIFETTMPKLREAREQLDRAEDELSKIIKEHKADVATVSVVLDRVESARSIHNKTRTLMLYRMHLVLTADQRQKVQAWRERQEAMRKDKESAPGHRRYP